MTELRAYAHETITAVLLDVLPAADLTELKERAAGLIAIAETNDLPIEQLILWIHSPAPEKEWSLREFRSFAEYVHSHTNSPPTSPA